MLETITREPTIERFRS